MAFHDVQFPTGLSYGSSVSVEHNVGVTRAPSGKPHVINRWTAPIRHWNVKEALKTFADLRLIHDFLLCRDGATHTFRFRCPFDNDTADTNPDETSVVSHTDQNIGIADGVQTDFVVTKTYSNGIHNKVRNILLPIISTVKVGLNGVDQPSGWQVIIADGENTVIRFDTAPTLGAGVISWGGSFDCHARFSEDASSKLDLSIDMFSTGSYANDIVIDEEPHPFAVDDTMHYGYGTSQPWTTGTLFWSYQMGRCIALQPSTGGLTFQLPSVSQYPEGGPHFYLINDSANTVTIDSVSLAASFTLAAGKGCIIHAINDGGTVRWMALKP